MASPEVLLARKLASNDLKTRQASENELKKWLRSKGRKGMKEIEMRRLWKGLYACMFMSDKPLVQVSVTINRLYIYIYTVTINRSN